MRRKRVAFIVPAHNEQDVIEATLRSLLKVTRKENIYVVDDGSKDSTVQKASAIISNVLEIKPNKGKANAINEVIRHFELTEKYFYILPMDADTVISRDFVKRTVATFKLDKEREIACVVGKVIGSDYNWITSYRMWEYEVAQAIHKSAQSIEGAVIVTPGCATLFRSEVFRTVRVPEGTLAEDMDLTFMIHRQKLGKIVYIDPAHVVTQDPRTLRDFLKQIDRWYIGFWQCLLKHNIPWGGQRLDAEVALLASEGLFNGILVIAMLFLVPFALFRQPLILALPTLFDLFLFLIPTMLFTAKKNGSYKIFAYIPHFYMVRFLSCLIFMRSFVKVTLGVDLKMTWFKAERYKSKEAPKWLSQSLR